MRPERSEAPLYFFSKYIDPFPGEDILLLLENQLEEALASFREISEENSLCRYASDKWTIREVLNHITDTERAFVFRALWFARGFTSPLESFDQTVSVPSAEANRYSWASHIEEFRLVRLATLAFYRNLPEAAWSRRGMVDQNSFTVRALAFFTGGHLKHHLAIVHERYLKATSL